MSLDSKKQHWERLEKNEKSREEMRKIVEAGNADELTKRLTWSLAFGTAGVRVRMGAGFNQLNDLTVLMLSMGFAQHLLDERKNAQQLMSIVIGYDGRHNSKRFAELSANVFVHAGIQVHLFADYVPTPVVSFAVRELKCDAGLMITASHNPKEDNGYKAYWANGAQILGPHDVEICRIAAAAEPTDAHWNLTGLRGNPLLKNADPVLEQYYAKEAALCCFFPAKKNSSLVFTYSAFHGVGSPFTRKMFEQFGFRPEQLVRVKEQDEPNPDFPTVPFPNPEEGHRVLDLCFRAADSVKSNLVLANDPDADRLQLAEKQPNGLWRVFTGNEMGALLTWWIWTNWRQRNPGADLANVFVLNSAVSSQIVATMAKHEGFQHRVSLTGFKWIGNLADELRAQGKTVILSWEESIGFTPGSTRDKDGVSAAAVFAEMAQFLLEHQNPPCTLQQQLFRIYGQYGFHLCQNSYWIVPGPETTRKIFAELRANGKYPEAIGQSGRVKFVRDLTTGFDSSQPDHRAILPLSTSSEMVTFTLDTGSIITLRASGTEPKIKYYIELRTEPGKTENDLTEVNAQLAQLERDVVDTLIQPRKYGLIARAK